MNNDIFDMCIVGGCGHVGLPLAITFAAKDQKVCVYDINEESIKKVKNGEMPFHEEGAEPSLREVLKKGNLTLFNDPSIISKCNIVVLIIGTPVDEHLNPKYGLMKKLIDQYLPYIVDGQLIILRSTVYPGISKRINDWLLEAGKKVHVAFCPERVLEGKAMIELESLPQIVSSFSEEGLKRSIELFKILTDDIVVLEPIEAELVKLFNNVWRYIKFATANHFYMIANDNGLDFYRIYEGMTHNYSRAKDFPKPGFAAGPCLFKDAMQLAAFNNFSIGIGHSAMLINEGLPNYVIQKLMEKYDLAEKTVGILGMAFKGDSDDIRESLSYKLKKILEVQSHKVLCSDPYVDDDRLVSMEEVLSKCDIIIIATPHSEYKNLVIRNKVIVDVWNILENGGLIG